MVAAFSVALQHDSRLFLDALDKNIVIVTTSTLLATMRTVVISSVAILAIDFVLTHFLITIGIT